MTADSENIAKADPEPGPSVFHDFDCTHDPCRCRTDSAKPDPRLVAAACMVHSPVFNRNCAVCVRRYYLDLIEQTYVPLHKYEALQRQDALNAARVASLQTELRDLRAVTAGNQPSVKP